LGVPVGALPTETAQGFSAKEGFAMKCRLQLEQLESRDTPSSFDPASQIVSFHPNTDPGVPFWAIQVPTNQNTPTFPDVQGFDHSQPAFDNAGVWGAPMVVLNQTW
jgi:hypothetical protein